MTVRCWLTVASFFVTLQLSLRTNWDWFYAINIIYLIKGNFITVLWNINASIRESFQENLPYLIFFPKRVKNISFKFIATSPSKIIYMSLEWIYKVVFMIPRRYKQFLYSLILLVRPKLRNTTSLHHHWVHKHISLIFTIFLWHSPLVVIWYKHLDPSQELARKQLWCQLNLESTAYLQLSLITNEGILWNLWFFLKTPNNIPGFWMK